MRALACLTLLAALAAPARAATVVIWPVDPVIQPDERGTALWLENKGREPVTLQVRTFAWAQAEGADRLDEQQAVVASPPIAVVAPGARQLVRIIRRAADAAPETAYRLLVDELPPPPAIAADSAVQARLSVQMRYSIPLFTYGAAARAPARLQARVDADGQGRRLTIHNAGATHVRLTDLRLVSAAGDQMVTAGLAGYVLAGSSLSIPLGTGAGAVKVAVDGTDQILTPSA